MNSPALKQALDIINGELAMLSRVKESIELYLGANTIKPTTSVNQPEAEQQVMKPIRSASTAAESKPCRTCGVPKPLLEFAKQKDCRSGRAGSCSACLAEKAKKRYWEKKANLKPQPKPAAEATKQPNGVNGYQCPRCAIWAETPEALERHVFRIHTRD